jgi:glucose/arabinose dehydrogenase
MDKKVDVSMVDKILSKVGLKSIEVKLEMMKLDDNTTVVEAEVFEAEQPIVIVTEDEQKIALPVGEYGLEDGRILVVQEEGIIFEIKDAQTEEEQPAEEEAVVASEAPTTAPVAKKVVESVSKESYFSKATEEEVIELIAKVIEMKMAEKVEVTEEVEEEAPAARVQNPEKTNLSVQDKGESLVDYLNKLK